MRTGRPKSALSINDEERARLLSIARARSLPAALTQRARIVLACEREPSNKAVGADLGVGVHTVGKWRNRFITHRLEGLYDELRSGRPRTIEDEAIAELLTKTLASRPKMGTHWSVRTMASETGLSKSTVHRFFQLFGLQPHRTRSFKLSTDPFFVEKLRDVVGLYLDPPDKALVLCVDEKSQIQALERTQPMLPMGFGYVEGVTHDYQRHGTTTLFAALNLLDGSILAQCKPRHRHQGSRLLRLSGQCSAKPTSISSSTITPPQAPQGQSLAGPSSRWRLHFTPTAFWLNQVVKLLRPDSSAIRRPSSQSRSRPQNRPLHQHPTKAPRSDGPQPQTPSRKDLGLCHRLRTQH
jgi:putative transposase